MSHPFPRIAPRSRPRRAVLVFLLPLMILAGAAHAGDEPLRILSVSPSGEDVPAARQIVIQFDRAVVPVGRMERDASELPVTVEPRLRCEWRWLNTSALACQLGEDDALVPATRYTVTVRPGSLNDEGLGLADEVVHTFLTQRPKVRRARFQTWASPGMPHLWVTFDQPVDTVPVAEHLFFDAGGRRVGSVVQAREQGIDPNTELTWRVHPEEELPLDTAVHLRVEPGLLGRGGPEPGIERRTVVEFHTFPEHRFLGVQCWSNAGRRVVVPAEGDPKAAPCNPLRTVALRFSSPVIPEILRDHLEVEPDLAGGRRDYDPWENAYSYSRLSSSHSRNQVYELYLPELLRADHDYSLTGSAFQIRDEFGRTLRDDIDLRFRTDNRPPNFTLTHPIAVLEQDVDTHLPITVTNLDQVYVHYQEITADGGLRMNLPLPIPEARNVAFHVPLKIRKWLGDRSGVVTGKVDSTPAIETDYRWFFSQVTPYQVHVKLGHRSSLVWVTDLATGEPVAGARVRIYLDSLATLKSDPEATAEDTTDADGLARLPGNDVLDPELDYRDSLDVPYRLNSGKLLFVRVDKDGEMGLLPLSWDFQVYAQGANDTWISQYQRQEHGHIRSWGTTAQGVYRLGDTVEYKIYVRDQDDGGLIPPPAGKYTLRVDDPMGKTVLDLEDLELNEFGALDGSFPVPENGAVGWYELVLSADYFDGSWYPLRVLVADFTPAPFRVTTDLAGELFTPGDELPITTLAKLHSGGPYADAQARITVGLSATPIVPSAPKAQGFFFQTDYGDTETLHQSEAQVDSQGELETAFTLPASDIPWGQLRVESAVRDDRGKYVAGSASARWACCDRYVGIHQDDWVLDQGRAATVKAMVIDQHGQLAADTEVRFRVEYRETKASRVKGAGNAYLTQYVHDWVNVNNCTETSGDEPVECEFVPERPGRYRLTAAVTDSGGRVHESTMNRWAVGKGQVLWEQPTGYQLPVEPEKNEYRVGDTARFLVRNPFPGAKALMTVERIGVQKSWTRTLESSTEIVELEIEPDHIPGFYFSVVVTSPRVEAPNPVEPSEDQPESFQVDLGKPTFRMGYARIEVRDPYKELQVDVRPRAETYKPRETVTVDLEARPRHPGDELPPMELAVAVLDESVFDLLATGRDYFDPYEGFYRLESLDLTNYNLLTRLIGLQKFEKKGANAGGGGSSGPDMRSVFKFVSYWNPSLKTDADGHATVTFDVPDNLTGWRVLVLGVTQDDLMGLGEGTFKVNQPVELRPALPNQVTEGDHFTARFTVMNRTEKKQHLTLTAKVDGPGESPGLKKLKIDAEPYKRYNVEFPIRAVDDGELAIEVEARTKKVGGKVEGDALRVKLPVRKVRALEAAATYGTTTDAEVEEKIAFPDGIRDDVGRVSVVASPSVIGGVEGAFGYLRDYPYICWEQKLTKGVMASHYAQLRDYLPDDLTWPGYEDLPRHTLELAANYQAPNGGMAYYIPEDRYASPYLSAYTALAFQWLRGHGHTIPSGVEENLHRYLRKLLRTDVFPDFYSKGMSSSVRAVALAALAASQEVDLRDLERYRRHVDDMDLFGKAHYLMAAVALGDEEVQDEVRDRILSHANQTGGKLVFTEEIDLYDFQRLHHSSARSQCAILSALVQQAFPPLDSPAGTQRAAPEGTGIGDLPFKLTRAITQERKRRGRWENTQENMFCMNALIDYSRVYENQEPDMVVRALLDEEELGETRFDDVRDTAVDLDRPIRKGDPGRQATVKITKDGPGRLYYSARLFYSPSDLKTDPINSGIEVRREVHVEREGGWVLLADPMEIERGELLRVDIYLSLPAARNFVVVDDPVPGGLEPVNRQLATASEVDAAKGDYTFGEAAWWWRFDDWIEFGASYWCFYHQEMRHHAVRFYSEYLPAGNYHLSYTAQAIATGEFLVMPSHAEEMYDPDVFGQWVPSRLVVGVASEE